MITHDDEDDDNEHDNSNDDEDDDNEHDNNNDDNDDDDDGVRGGRSTFLQLHWLWEHEGR